MTKEVERSGGAVIAMLGYASMEARHQRPGDETARASRRRFVLALGLGLGLLAGCGRKGDPELPGGGDPSDEEEPRTVIR